jgi:hypothetical protein
MICNVREVSKESDLSGIVDVTWAAMGEVDSSQQVFYPTFGTGPEAQEPAIAESKMRLWNEHQSDSLSRWVYISAEDGQIIAGCWYRQQHLLNHAKKYFLLCSIKILLFTALCVA